MGVAHYTVSWLIRIILSVLCRIDAGELRKLPKSGPYILISNHINFLEVPVIYTYGMPRQFVALVKAENWENPFFAFLGNLWHAIPIARGSVDRRAIAKANEALSERKILVIAPEGTRSRNGKLRPAFPGVVLFAVNSGIPVYPAGHFGGERFWRNLRSLKRTNFTVRIGKPFTVWADTAELTRRDRKDIADEMMCRIAGLLPDRLRGHYAGLIHRDYNYIRMV